MRPEHPSTANPLSLPELFADYLRRQTSAHEAGLALPDSDEVVPYDAAPAQPVEPRLAWDEAAAALRCFRPELPRLPLKPPAEWPTLVTAQEPVAALPLAAGNFPQLVRNLSALVQAAHLGDLRSTHGRPVEAVGLADWAAQCDPSQSALTLFTAGVLRLARQYDQAADLLRQGNGSAGEWRDAWANEEAALAWQQGRAEEADKMWQAQPESVPVLFNRGMAALFLNRAADARGWLRRAAERLPENDAWHHLARLYLALAEMRG
jgi:tetratricopeptide (TPR) repeat protein